MTRLRSALLQIYLHDHELEQLRAHAQSQGLALATWGRAKLLAELTAPAPKRKAAPAPKRTRKAAPKRKLAKAKRRR